MSNASESSDEAFIIMAPDEDGDFADFLNDDSCMYFDYYIAPS